jgi:orotate phosphoribosyltransferase
MAYDLMEELRAVGALKEGHFLLSSGKHSDRYVEKFDLLRDPAATQRACAEWARLLADVSSEAQLVAGPTTGGILLAFELARQLELRAAYAERSSEGSSRREFKRGTVIEPGTPTIVVDDIMTTGGSIQETLAALRAVQAEVLAVCVLVDRSAGQVDFGVPIVSLGDIAIDVWDPEDCPLCAGDIPLVKPGTTAPTRQS